MTTTPDANPQENEVPGRSRMLAACSVVAGLLTLVLGFLVCGMGYGFANATAGGTGAAAMCVGLWMVLAVRGVARRRPTTFLGLGLAWVWLVGRIVVDFPATAITAVVLGGLIGGPILPLALAWVVLMCFGGLGAGFRMIGVYRGRAYQRPTARTRVWIGIGVRLGLLVAVTLAVPPWLWSMRGRTIAELAEEYAQPEGDARPRAEFGACTVTFLGYELTRHGAEKASTEDQRQEICRLNLAGALADLESIAAAGAKYVRVGASGDHLLATNEAPTNEDQEKLDDQYMEAVDRTGIPLVLVDCQHPQALGKRLNWEEFCRFQGRRIEYYQRRYHPEVYLVVCEPLSYHQFFLTGQTAFSADAWAEQLSEMCRLVKSIDTNCRTGITLLVAQQKRPEWEVWARMRNLPELDILSVEIYEPNNFHQTQQWLEEFGHPSETGKSFWIAETYNGWALCAQRRWDQDVAWLHVADDFAQVVQAEAVLVWTFGSFVPEGSYYDFIRGRLHQHWEPGAELSAIGRGFAELQASRP